MAAVTHQNSDVRIEQLPARRMAYLHVVGPYGHETLGPAFGKIIHWAIDHQVMTADTICIGVYYDNPDVTPPEQQRADVGITVGDQFQPAGEVRVQTLAAGPYAVLRHTGHYDTLGEAYRWLFGVWFPGSGRQPSGTAPYELYVNDASKHPPEEWLTDICVPLAGQ